MTSCEIDQNESDQAIEVIPEFRRSDGAQLFNQFIWERDAAADGVLYSTFHFTLFLTIIVRIKGVDVNMKFVVQKKMEMGWGPVLNAWQQLGYCDYGDGHEYMHFLVLLNLNSYLESIFFLAILFSWKYWFVIVKLHENNFERKKRVTRR